MRIAFALLASVLCLSLSSFAAADDKTTKPNILFILADDFGLDGVGCYGSDRFKGKTPNLDALAESGTRFTHCYAMPLCGPSRCTIMTGRYGFRTGGATNQSAGHPSFKDEPSVARNLKQANYVTGMAGKWRQVGATPGDWGFDDWLTDPTAGGWYWKNSYTQNGKLIETKRDVYNPDVCMEFTLDFLRRNRDLPFYFYFSSHLIHGPILKTPDSKADGKSNLYEDNVAYLDKQVGQLVAEIDKLGLRERTVIIFSGDNGTAKFGSEHSVLNGRHINGQKGSMHEGGARVPLIASWKGTMPSGQVRHDLIDFSDMFATFSDLAGAKMPEGVTFDSRSFAPALRGQKGDPRGWAFVQLGGKWYVREPGFKLTESGELLDMSDAPFVEKAVAKDAESAEAKAARTRLQAVLDKLNPASGKGSNDAPPKKRKAGKKKTKAVAA